MKRAASRYIPLRRPVSILAAQEPALLVCAGLGLALVLLSLRIVSLW